MSEKQLEKEQNLISKQNFPEEPVTEQTNQQIEKVVAKVIQSEFSGPIPPPNIIRGYEEILPGAADRIITMAEKQSEHRQRMEKKMIYSEARDSLLGVIFAFVLGIGCIIGAIVIAYLIPQNAGAIGGALLGVTGIGSITSGFIRSAKGNTSKEERSDT